MLDRAEITFGNPASPLLDRHRHAYRAVAHANWRLDPGHGRCLNYEDLIGEGDKALGRYILKRKNQKMEKSR